MTPSQSTDDLVNRVSDKKRLDFWIEWYESRRSIGNDQTAKFLRELRDYRKAVREYLSAVDAIRDFTIKEEDVQHAASLKFRSAEATLRALQESTGRHLCPKCGVYTCTIDHTE